MAVAQSKKAGKSHGIRQQKIKKRKIDVAFRRQDIQRLPNRRRLEDSGVRMRNPDCIAECFAKQRMIIDNEESHHESLTRSIGCIQVMTPAASCTVCRYTRTFRSSSSPNTSFQAGIPLDGLPS